VRVEREIDDVADAECVDVGELRLSRLTRRGDSVVESTPVVDAFWVGHYSVRVVQSTRIRRAFVASMGSASPSPFREARYVAPRTCSFVVGHVLPWSWSPRQISTNGIEPQEPDISVPDSRRRGARRERQCLTQRSSVNADPCCPSPCHTGAQRRRAASRTGQPVGDADALHT